MQQESFLLWDPYKTPRKGSAVWSLLFLNLLIRKEIVRREMIKYFWVRVIYLSCLIKVNVPRTRDRDIYLETKQVGEKFCVNKCGKLMSSEWSYESLGINYRFLL